LRKPVSGSLRLDCSSTRDFSVSARDIASNSAVRSRTLDSSSAWRWRRRCVRQRTTSTIDASSEQQHAARNHSVWCQAGSTCTGSRSSCSLQVPSRLLPRSINW
jgi:hypothetical protein